MQVEKFARCKLIGTSKTRQPIISYSANALFYSNYSQETSDADELQCIANDMHAPPQCLRNECQAKAASSSRKCMACQHAEPFETFATSLHRVEYDRYTTRKLLKLRTEWDCGLADLAKEYHQVYYANQDAPGSRTNLSVDGLACASNTSLTLVAMDSLLYHHFAESLGVDVLQHKRKTALVIVNPKDEAHAVFDGHFSDRSLREFILNFTSNNLPRALVDAGREFTHTHLYWRAACATGDICIQELNSKTFVSTIKNPKKVAVVFYYSRQCAFCTGVSHTYLEAARILANVSSIQFLRIDGDRNTLPWEYTMDKYPSILLFPLLHKSESRAYPETMPITLMNLLSFILANLDPLLKLQSMWEICSYTKFEADRTKCISIVRRENLAQIETTLREWRKADPRSRQRIIYKLQLLKNIHLHLATALKRAQHIGNEFERLARSSLHVALIQFIGNYFKSWGEDL